MRKSQKKIKTKQYLQLGILVGLLLLLPVSLALVKTITTLLSKASGSTARLFLPSTMNVTVGQEIIVPLTVSTDISSIKGLDVMVKYNPSLLQLTDVVPVAANARILPTFTPLTSSNTFDVDRVISSANQTGVLEFGATTVDMSQKTILSAYKGTTQAALLKFKGLRIGSALVEIIGLPGSSKDSNLIVGDAQPIDILQSSSQITNLTVSIQTTATPTPVPPTNPSPSPILQTGNIIKISPVDDASIEKSNPTSNYGNQTTLKVDASGRQDTLIKFSVQGISGRKVLQAKLFMYCINSSGKGGDFRLLPTNSWTESTVTWNTAPASNPTILTTLGAVSARKWYSVNFGSLIMQDGVYSFKITSTSSDGADYVSSEGNYTYRPYLELTLE